jgi:carboxylesterase
LNQLLAVLRAEISKITAPVLLVHSRQDTGVDPSNMQAIFDRLSTPLKEQLWVDDSGHVVTREPERERVFAAAADFIQRVDAMSSPQST